MVFIYHTAASFFWHHPHGWRVGTPRAPRTMRLVRLPDDLSGGWHARVADVMRAAFHASATPRAAPPRKRWWGALDDEARLVAAANLEEGVLWDLSVLPTHQGQGFGTALLAHVVRRWRGDVRVFVDRPELIGWYAQRGFVHDDEDAVAWPTHAIACLVRRNAAQESRALRQTHP